MEALNFKLCIMNTLIIECLKYYFTITIIAKILYSVKLTLYFTASLSSGSAVQRIAKKKKKKKKKNSQRD